MLTYPDTDYESARRSASRLLTRADVQEAIDERMRERGLLENFTEDEWAKIGFELLANCRNESVKARIWEVFGKSKGIFKDNVQNLAIFQQIQGVEDDILKRRRYIIEQEDEGDNKRLT
jgi:phage terminase small subunit